MDRTRTVRLHVLLDVGSGREELRGAADVGLVGGLLINGKKMGQRRFGAEKWEVRT